MDGLSGGGGAGAARGGAFRQEVRQRYPEGAGNLLVLRGSGPHLAAFDPIDALLGQADPPAELRQRPLFLSPERLDARPHLLFQRGASGHVYNT